MLEQKCRMQPNICSPYTEYASQAHFYSCSCEAEPRSNRLLEATRKPRTSGGAGWPRHWAAGVFFSCPLRRPLPGIEHEWMSTDDEALHCKPPAYTIRRDG